jgi:hypothetical protein
MLFSASALLKNLHPLCAFAHPRPPRIHTSIPPSLSAHNSLPNPRNRQNPKKVYIPHLIQIPRLRALTTRRLARANLQVLGREAHRALDAEVLALGTLDQLAADLLQGGDFARGQGNADLVDLGRILLLGLFGVVGHLCGW